jgi:hypothetical protein
MRGFDKSKVILACSLFVSVLLHLMGVTFVLVGVCIVAGARLLPAIPAMSSLVGRLFASVLLFFAVMQVSATVQFFVWPASDFRMTAAVTAGIYLIAVVPADVRSTGSRGGGLAFADRHDAAAAIVAAMFLLPFAPILVGDDTVARVAQIGGGQASDGATHFSMIAEMVQRQHLTYGEGPYYPQGFHITVAFLQDSLFISQTGADWRGAVFLYIAQYLFFGTLLAGAIGYFVSSVLGALTRRDDVRNGVALLCAASAATGALAALFVLLPFVLNGFLNYLYALATILVAFGVLLTGSRERLFSTVFLYLVFTFGAGLSWPLLVPPLLASLVLVLCRRDRLRSLVGLPRRQLVALAVLLGLQLLPVAFQLLYSGEGASQNINALGNLRTFHSLSLLLGALVIAGIAASSAATGEFKERGVAIVLPLLAFTGLLALAQLFFVGEVRYYVIKVAFLLEVVNMVFLSCLAAVVLSRMDLSSVVRFSTAAVMPVAVVLSLFAVSADPLADVRNLFRTAADQVKPTFFDADLGLYAALGEAGEVGHFNTTLLHYDSGTGKYFAHMQIPFWANMMKYDATRGDAEALACHFALFSNLTSGTASEAEQAALVEGVRECAEISRDRGREYIIVTDPLSESAVEAEFGGIARIETHAQR